MIVLVRFDRWIGASDKEGEMWKWYYGNSADLTFFNGTTAQGGSYTNWASGQPDNASPSENYGMIWDSNKWNDAGTGLIPNYLTEWEGSAVLNRQTYANTASIKVNSNEAGTAYLVNSSYAPTKVSDITGYADAQWNSVAIASANQVLASDNFDNSNANGWLVTGGTAASSFLSFNGSTALGRYGYTTASDAQAIYKTYALGSTYANQKVTIEFDMYELDSWDSELFSVYVNNSKVSSVVYHYSPNIIKDGGIDLGDISNSSNGGLPGYIYHTEELHHYTLQGTTDASGNLKLGFGSTLSQEGLYDESYVIDNVQLSSITPSSSISLSGLADGTYKLYTADAAGNLSAAASNTITVDTTAPPPATSLVTTDALGNRSNGGTLTNSGDTALVKGSAVASTAYLVLSTDNVSSVADINALGAGHYVSTLVAANTETGLSTTGLIAGTYKLYMADAAGNLSAAFSNTVNVVDGYTLHGSGVEGFNLIAPYTTTVAGVSKTFYFLDKSGDGIANNSNVSGNNSEDLITHDQLDAIFGNGADTSNANRVNTTAVSGKTLLLATGPSTSSDNAVATDSTSGKLINGVVQNNDLAQIWDANNTSLAYNGVPTGWASTRGDPVAYYWAATGSTGAHSLVALNMSDPAYSSTLPGWFYAPMSTDTFPGFAAVQVTTGALDTTAPAGVDIKAVYDNVGGTQGYLKNDVNATNISSTTNDTNLSFRFGWTPGSVAVGDVVTVFDNGATLKSFAITQTDLDNNNNNSSGEGAYFGEGSSYTNNFAEGSHSITIKVTDSAGNSSISSAMAFTISFDTTAPWATLDPTYIATNAGLDSSGNSVISMGSGGTTRDNTWTIYGSTDEAATVKFYDNGSLLGSFTFDGGNGGQWSYTTPALSSGTHTLYATVTDVAGNMRTTNSISGTVDTSVVIDPYIEDHSYTTNQWNGVEQDVAQNWLYLNPNADTVKTWLVRGSGVDDVSGVQGSLSNAPRELQIAWLDSNAVANNDNIFTPGEVDMVTDYHVYAVDSSGNLVYGASVSLTSYGVWVMNWNTDNQIGGVVG